MLSIQELRSSTQKELLQELSKRQGELLKIRISVKTKHEKDSSKVVKMKRYVAQLKTSLNELSREEEAKKDS